MQAIEMMVSTLVTKYSFFCTEMVIGFAERIKSVSESEAGDGFDSFDVPILAHSQIPSEVQIEVQIRVVSGFGQAIVRETNTMDTDYDALFGSVVMNRLLEIRQLPGDGETVDLATILIKVRNDLRAEDEVECLNLQIEKTDFERTSFTCYNDFPTDYSCIFTLCIVDDDGGFAPVIIKMLLCICMCVMCVCVNASSCK